MLYVVYDTCNAYVNELYKYILYDEYAVKSLDVSSGTESRVATFLAETCAVVRAFVLSVYVLYPQ